MRFLLYDVFATPNSTAPKFQACFNEHPLDRADDDGDASPIDPNHTGRYGILVGVLLDPVSLRYVPAPVSPLRGGQYFINSNNSNRTNNTLHTIFNQQILRQPTVCCRRDGPDDGARGLPRRCRHCALQTAGGPDLQPLHRADDLL